MNTIAGVPVVVAVALRIHLADRVDGLYYYNVREDDDGSPYSLEKFVFVNHFGTIATSEPIELLEVPANGDVANSIILSDDDINTLFQMI